MLDNQHQINIYGMLNTTPVHSADSVVKCGTISAAAQTKATAAAALHVSTITYPATITAQLNKLTGWITALQRVKSVCDTFKTNVTPYQDPNQMIELYIGWQIHCKVGNITDVTKCRTNNAVGDTTIVNALNTALTAIDLTALTKAWTDVNTALTPAPVTGGTSGATTPVTPALSQTLITALQTATTAIDPKFSALGTATTNVENLGKNAKQDGDIAASAFNRAVMVSILTNLAGNTILTNSLKAIVPANMYTELQAANANS